MALSDNSLVHTLLIIEIILVFTSGITSKKLCGQELSDSLRAICKNKYNGFSRVTEPPVSSSNTQIYEYQSIPFISKLTGGVLSPRVRRNRRGVADECCKKACTYAELSSYCYES